MAEKPYNGFPASYRQKQGSRVYEAFKSGEIARPDKCVMCAREAEGYRLLIQAHNEDYHDPFGFVGVCFPCHMAIHARFKNPHTWHRWRDAVASGWQPPRTRDYRVFREIWESFRVKPVGEVDETNWAFSLPDVEPDLYTNREPVPPPNALF